MAILPIDNGRYGTKEMMEIFSEQKKVDYQLEIEGAAAISQSEIGPSAQRQGLYSRALQSIIDDTGKLRSHERNIKWLNNRHIIYRRDPINDIPTIETNLYKYYEDGTHEAYHLFNSKAKITTYRSLKWHFYVLHYLNHTLHITIK